MSYPLLEGISLKMGMGLLIYKTVKYIKWLKSRGTKRCVSVALVYGSNY